MTVIKEWKYGYAVSDDGKVYGKDGGVLSEHISGKNWCVTIYAESRISTKTIARIVAEVFVPNSDPSVKTTVIHINGDKHDNRAENLQWVSKRVASLTRYNKE